MLNCVTPSVGTLSNHPGFPVQPARGDAEQLGDDADATHGRILRVGPRHPVELKGLGAPPRRGLTALGIRSSARRGLCGGGRIRAWQAVGKAVLERAAVGEMQRETMAVLGDEEHGKPNRALLAGSTCRTSKRAIAGGELEAGITIRGNLAHEPARLRRAGNQRLVIGGFALPHDTDVPTVSFEIADVSCVPGSVLADLLAPIVDPAGGQTTLAAVVPVPEAAVDEDCLAPMGEYEIRAAWQVATVKSVSVPHSVKPPPYRHFGRGVPLSDRGHDP